MGENAGRASDRKRALRQALRAARAAIAADERARIDAIIAKKILCSWVWVDATVVYTYLSFGCEVDTRALIEHAWREDKRVALPRCVPGTRSMRWFFVDSYEGLERSPMGIEEPPIDATRVAPAVGCATALALVPGLAFDAQGFRIGYGGGFYDGFLAGFEGISVGMCRMQFIVDDLPSMGVVEPHDLPVDLIACEDRELSTCSYKRRR